MRSLVSRFLSFGPAFLLASTAALAQLESLPAEGLAQIQAYTAEKLSRTPAEKKLDSTLLYAMRTMTGQAMVSGVPGPLPFIQGFIAEHVAPDTTVQVTIQGDINAGLLAAIAAAGGTQVQPFPQFNQVTARMPIAALLVISDRDDVRFIRPIEEGTTNRYIPTDDERRALLAKATSPVTNATSQGFHAHGADLAVSTGIDGTGVKICVLSDGVNSVTTLQGAGELPAVDVVSGQAGSGDEGTAMLQIVHDMAPNAALGFATANGGTANFANNIILLRNAPHNCDIIVDDFTYFLEGPFQDDTIAQAVNTVTAGGALYFSSAANSGNLTHGTSGTWEGDFVNGGAASSPITEAGTLHSFGATPYDVLNARGSAIVLQWSDPLAGSSNDYDLFVLNSAGTTVVSFSDTVQNGTQAPHEFISCSTTSNCPVGGRIVVVLFSGATRALRVDTERGGLSIQTAGATFGHNAAGSGFSVAAINVASAGGGQFSAGTGVFVESYNSDGPRKIFYNPNGTVVTPGNVLFGTGGGTTLAKDDLTAADCAHSFVGGFDPFCGTSAAAPHAAAIAGLIKSAKLTATNAQIKTALLNSALDIEALGPDRDSGVGIVMAPAGVRAALNTLVVAKSFVANSIVAGGTSVLTITLQNTNAVAIKGVAFTDTYPTNVVNAATPNANITGAGCTGTLSATGGGNTLALSSGVVPSGTTCSYKVTVTSGVAGTYVDGSGAVTTPISLNSSAASASLTVGPGSPPTITSASSTSFTVGVFGTFTVTTTGTPAISKTGALPGGVTFVDNGNGTATLSGTASAAGIFPLTITAINGVLPNATQSFTLIVNATVPGPPTGATAVAGNAQATVTFVAPASNGGSAITGYTVISNPAGGVDSNAGTLSTSHLVTGLTNGIAYTFTVTAANAIGTGPPSAASNSVTPAAVTPPPTLTYTPVTPCRLVDTRVAVGAFAARSGRNYAASDNTRIGQAGGNPAGCNIPVGPEALALTLTVVVPPQVGNLVAYPAGGAVPLASALNFLPGQIIANTTIVPITPGAGDNFSVFNNSDGTTPVVVDVVGYFWEFLSADCTKATQSLSVGAGGTIDVTASCTTGYVAVGGGCSTDTAGASSWLSRSATVTGDGYHCKMQNGSGGSVNVTTDTLCCRRAGR